MARNGYTLVATDITNPAVGSTTSNLFNIDALPRVNPLLSVTQGPDGHSPSSPLVADSSGNLYGLTSSGGLYDAGTVYELSGVNHSIYTPLVSFPVIPNQNIPLTSFPMVMDHNGNLYGTHGNTVFELSANHTTLTTLATFTGTSGNTLGTNPNGLTIDSNGNLFGTTSSGGTSGFTGLGTVFEITASHQFINLLSFTGSSGPYEGETPMGALSIDSNGNLYGTTEFNSNGPGVPTTNGTVFELAADHQTFTTLVTFTGTSGAYPGSNPQGSLAIDSQGDIFGTTAGKQQNGDGVGNGTVFELAADHTTFTSLLAFTGGSGNYPGAGPESLVIDGRGNLYGATGSSVFELAANHTTYTTLASFSQTYVPEGGPSVALSFDGAGNLYLTTTGGGPSGIGSALEFSGAGHATVSTLDNFTSGNPINPQSPLAVDQFGNLYGTLGDSIFELSAPNYSTYTTVYTATTGLSNLIIDKSGNLYGIAGGSIFELAADHTTFTILVTFTGDSGNYLGTGPQALTLDSNGDIYGTTTNGGLLTSGQAFGGDGTVFEMSSNHQTFTSLLSFTGSTGSYPGAEPEGGLTIDSSGNLYGTTEWTGNTNSGSTGDGTIFELSADRSTFTSLYTFSTASGPTGTMVMDGSGNMYGTTGGSLNGGTGTIFKLSAAHVVSFLFQFASLPAQYSRPVGNLAIDSQGNLYGATIYGQLYELSTNPVTFTTLVPANTSSNEAGAGASSDSIGNVFITTADGGIYSQGGVTEIAADGTNNLVENSGVTTIAPPPGVPPLAGETFSSISVGPGATIAATPSPAGPTVLITNTLSLAGSTGAWTGTLDLTNNDLDITGGSLATITSQIQHAYNGGTWTGQGITSTSAASNANHLTALGVIQNNQSGTALYTASNPLDGTVPGAGDVLVKYTYYGDANLDGKVDGSDYSRIDNGSLNNLTGWFNGDFNCDGIINGSDYTLIDNAYNVQGASLAAEPAAAVATPVADIATTDKEPALKTIPSGSAFVPTNLFQSQSQIAFTQFGEPAILTQLREKDVLDNLAFSG